MKARLFFFLIFFLLFSIFHFPSFSLRHDSFGQGTWTARTSLGGVSRHTAVGFSIGTKGYIGTGFYVTSSPFYKKDFWEWDQASNSWTQKADFGGTARTGAVGFSIGTKGYIGTGWGGSYPQDFWEYDPSTNIWTPKANFPGAGREWAVGFSIGTKGYIGTGNAPSLGGRTQDFWEWDQTTNTWAQKANFPGVVRFSAVGLSIGNKGYVGTGNFGPPTTLQKDFWEYDPPTNMWTQKSDFPSAMAEGTAFRIGKYGYVGAGTTQIGSGSMANLWKYDPSSNSWTAIPDFGGGLREMAVGFSIGCYGYLGTGFINDNITSYKKDFWEYYNPADTTCGCSSTVTTSNVSCNGGNNGSATITAFGGIPTYTYDTSPYTYSWSPTGGINATANGLTAGIYTIAITDAVGCTQTQTITITEPTALTTTITSQSAICNNDDGTANATVSGGIPSYTYLWSPIGGAGSVATGLSPGTYTATIIDANGCSSTHVATIEPPINAEALYLPNAFSPNNDGENDGFCLSRSTGTPSGQGAKDSCIQEITITIYDRWGEQVFQSNDSKFCWDGMYKDKPQNSAVFVYYLEAKLVSGKQIKKQGNISLMR